MRSPATTGLRTDRLVLTPLQPLDASEMIGVLSDSELYTFTGGHPPTLEELESRYRAQVAGPSTGDQVWHNWILRLAGSQAAIGFVQATVIDDSADVAWVVGIRWQSQGFATEAASARCIWLATRGTAHLTAHIHPDHASSASVASAIGLQPTAEVDSDGEIVWASPRSDLDVSGSAPP